MEIACEASPELDSEPAELAGPGRRASMTVTAATARPSLLTVTAERLHPQRLSREEFCVMLNGWVVYSAMEKEKHKWVCLLNARDNGPRHANGRVKHHINR